MVVNVAVAAGVDCVQRTMEDLSFENIAELDDVFVLMQLADDHGVRLDGCSSTDDMKERFVMHKRKLLEQHVDTNVSSCHHIKKDIDLKREALIPLFSSVKDGLAPGMHCIQDILSDKGICDNFARDLDNGVAALSTRECCVVIAGATGAGKSTFLNLLLGMNILPEHVLSCTATVCKLKYDTEFKSRILFKNGGSRIFSYKNFEDAKSRLENEIFIKNLAEREDMGVLTAKEIEIYLPADILKFGMTIVDTPGIDENEAMDDLVRTFITTNHIAAFMYIVKSDVQQEGLLNFLQSLLEKKSSQGSLTEPFNPKAAMFICNKWDLIPDKDKQKVKDHVIQKLEAVWTGLQPSQVKFFSTLNARFHQEIDHDYKTDEFRGLLKDIDQLFVIAMQNTIDIYYSWLKRVLEECSFYTRKMLASLQTTQEEQEEGFFKASEKMKALKSHARDIMTDLRGQLEEETNIMVDKMRQFFQLPEIKREMQVWTDDDIPFSDFSRIKDVNSQTIVERRDLAILRRLFHILDSWEEVRKFKINVETRMGKQIKEKLFLLDDEMIKISNELKDSDSLKSSYSSNHSTVSLEDGGLSEDIMSRSFMTGVAGRLNTLIQNTQSSSANKISKAVVAGAVQPMLETIIKTKLYMERRRASSVISDSYMHVRAGKMLKGLTATDELMVRLVERYTDKELNQLNSIEKNIPKFVQATDRLIHQIRLMREQNQEEQSVIKEMAVCLKHQMDQLRGFDRMFNKEIAPDDITLVFDDIDLNTSTISKDPGVQRRDAYICLWSLLQKGEQNLHTHQKAVLVKLYFQPLSETVMYREISKLRTLNHSSVCPFIGMTHVDKRNAFVFGEQLTSARRYLKRGFVSKRDVVPKLLTELVEGLSYIHQEQLVHMELTEDTVMINQFGEVKLCGTCLPRRAKMPRDTEFVEAGEFTCLSPEVLHGSVYEAEADVYSLGLLIWQMILEEKPYQQQWRMSLSTFIAKVNPSEMLNIPCTSTILHSLLHGCLLPEPSFRIKMADIKDQLKLLIDDPVMSQIQNTFKRSKVLKRQSKIKYS